MKFMTLKRFAPVLLALLLALVSVSACASEGYSDAVDGIYAYVCGDLTKQAWVDEIVSEGAGGAMDGYIITLNRSEHDLDFSAYMDAAAQKVQDGGISNPVSRMRCALALLSCGAVDRIPASLPDECIGKLGVMSYVYGLHLINNGMESTLWTRDAIISKLLELQKEDGGWAVTGAFGDVDVTAMCLQALSVGDRSDEVQSAVDRALEMLSARQLEGGGFISMGRENSESASQVLTALCSLGIDPAADARFIKDGNSIIDVLMAYQMPSGGFAHLPGDAENETACIQALQAFSALQQPGIPYFDFSAKAEQLDVPTQARAGLPLWKLCALGGIAAFLLIGCVFALTRRHGRAKQLLFVVLIAAVAAAAVMLINIETTSDYYSAQTPEDSDGSVWLSIRCDTVAGRADDGSTPENGEIIPRTEFPCNDGDTVFDILTAAARKYALHMEHDGRGDLAYINGINYLYEYAYGELSGWVYTLNGERLSTGCGACAVKSGDEIIWQYTLNLGEDIK